MAVTECLTGVILGLCGYLFYQWFRDPIRKIPGPRGLPLVGNVLSINPEKLHTIFYDFAIKYGPVFKVHMFTKPLVVVNSIDACYEGLIQHGADMQGRPHVPRLTTVIKKDVAFTSYEHNKYATLRKVFTKGLKSYGTGMARLEKAMQDTIQDVFDVLLHKEGEVIDTHELTYGFVCCIVTTVLFGEKYSFDDPICQSMHIMNTAIIECIDPKSSSAILDLYPGLFNFKFLFKECHQHIEKAILLQKEHIYERIKDAKATYHKKNQRGCLDYFIQAQMDELDENGNPIIDDDCLVGLTVDFIVGGMETSLASLSQAFLDLLYQPELMKKLQDEIDSKFEPAHMITLQDKEELPFLEAFIHENLRLLTQVPMLVPHMALKDTLISGYTIPKGTQVFFNSFFTAHNPDVYDEPFKCKPERFLGADGKIVEHGHPLRRNFIGFGGGRRQCPGELLARSRIFLFLANILHKFDIEPAGELPNRDVRDYKMHILLEPPSCKVHFNRRR